VDPTASGTACKTGDGQTGVTTILGSSTTREKGKFFVSIGYPF
jgi:hypothetical protein